MSRSRWGAWCILTGSEVAAIRPCSACSRRDFAPSSAPINSWPSPAGRPRLAISSDGAGRHQRDPRRGDRRSTLERLEPTPTRALAGCTPASPSLRLPGHPAAGRLSRRPRPCRLARAGRQPHDDPAGPPDRDRCPRPLPSPWPRFGPEKGGRWPRNTGRWKAAPKAYPRGRRVAACVNRVIALRGIFFGGRGRFLLHRF